MSYNDDFNDWLEKDEDYFGFDEESIKDINSRFKKALNEYPTKAYAIEFEVSADDIEIIIQKWYSAMAGDMGSAVSILYEFGKIVVAFEEQLNDEFNDDQQQEPY